mmetsp:Transcript_6191/g.19720  ORF Transcript_6191/g.19720 Transcript_6191/m.19720 type:complete len:423 (+) Transcript_6191:3-1271(+)
MLEERLARALSQLEAEVPATESGRDRLRRVADEVTTTPARCRPWNRDDYLARLRSFTVSRWFAKPASASAIECARRGWSCVGKDLLECACCRARLAFKLTVQAQSEAFEEGAALFAEKLSTAHAEVCPWQNQSCPAQFVSVVLAPRSEFLRTSVRRARALWSRLSSTPALASSASFATPFLDAQLPARRRPGQVVDACVKLVKGEIADASPDSGPRKRRRLEGSAATAGPAEGASEAAPDADASAAPVDGVDSRTAPPAPPAHAAATVRAVVEAADQHPSASPPWASAAVWCAVAGALGWEPCDASVAAPSAATALVLHCSCCAARVLLRAGASAGPDPVRAHRSWCPYLGAAADEGSASTLALLALAPTAFRYLRRSEAAAVSASTPPEAAHEGASEGAAGAESKRARCWEQCLSLLVDSS